MGAYILKRILLMIPTLIGIMLMTFAVFAVYGLFAAAVRDQIIARPRVLTWMRRSFAAAFASFSARFFSIFAFFSSDMPANSSALLSS